MNWTPHYGYACPVPPTTKVAVQFRNGWECTDAVEAGEYDWTWSGHTDLHIVGFAEVAQVGEAMGDDSEDDLRVSITELGEVVTNDTDALKAMFDALPEVPYGGIKSIDVTLPAAPRPTEPPQREDESMTDSEDGWQGMDSAPPNGVRVDLWNGIERVADCFCHNGTWRTTDDDYPIEATHWRWIPSEPRVVSPAPALDYEAQFRMVANSKAGAWGMVDVLRDMARRLDELEKM